MTHPALVHRSAHLCDDVVRGAAERLVDCEEQVQVCGFALCHKLCITYRWALVTNSSSSGRRVSSASSTVP